jgi:hypothetical protein
VRRLFYDVADGQRLGMKMKLRCDIRFAGLAKLVTSGSTDGDVLARLAVGWLGIVRALGA